MGTLRCTGCAWRCTSCWRCSWARCGTDKARTTSGRSRTALACISSPWRSFASCLWPPSLRTSKTASSLSASARTESTRRSRTSRPTPSSRPSLFSSSPSCSRPSSTG
eukprot:Amastigsp_a175409_18.p3 type:complete len:108 gc:universal Amastigsp_a175409_18:1-324(+)